MRPARALLLLTLALFATTGHAERVMVGSYATFGDLPVEQIPWDQLTHVCHAFLRIDAQGEVVTTDAIPNPALTAEGRKNRTPVLVTVGGGVTVKGLEAATATKESTLELAKAIARVMHDGAYEGVDLAWEFPRNAATRDAHARLVLELRRCLDWVESKSPRERGYLLSVAVSPSDFLGQWVDTKRIAPAVDWLNVMAYDMSGPWSNVAGHNAPLFPSPRDPEADSRSVSGAMRYWENERGVPKNKLVLGAPLFGRMMPASAPLEELDPDRVDQHRVMPFHEIRKLAGKGWRAQWDAPSRAPWLEQPKTEREPAPPLTPVADDAEYDGPIMISYEDRNSIDMKTGWAREQGYRGMSFWALHQDRMPDGRHWLLNAANRAWPAE